jgi:hypothetical protein
MIHSWRALFLPTILCQIVSSGPLEAEECLRRVCAALEEQAERLSSIRLTYECRRFSGLEENELECVWSIPPEAMRRQTHTIALQGPYWYASITRSTGFGDEFREVQYDGRTVSFGVMGSIVTILDESAIEMRLHEKARLYDPRYFEAVGIDVPNVVGELGLATRSNILLELMLAGTGGVSCEQMQAGPVSLRIASGAEERLYRLDPLRGCVMIGSELFRGGILLERVETDNLATVAGAWLPRRVKRKYYHWYSAPELISGVPVIVEEYTVNVISAEDQLARLPLKSLQPGSTVSDARWGGAPTARRGFLSYTQPMPLEGLWDELERRLQLESRTSPSRSELLLVAWGLGHLGIVILAASACIRRRLPTPRKGA